MNLIKAKQSIEDWFLYDLDGVFRFLKLKNSTKVNGENGIDKLQKLFIKSNKTYIKGTRCDDFIKSLDIEKIVCSICDDIKYLCLTLNVKCENILEKQVN